MRLCPMTGGIVLYLDCLECEDRKVCRENQEALEQEKEKKTDFTAYGEDE